MFQRVDEGVRTTEINKKKWKTIYPVLIFIIILGLSLLLQNEKLISTCYKEKVDSLTFPETYFIQKDLKEVCTSKGVIIREIGIDY